jgi:tetratricopeptide (TPR) repeat protein
VTGDARAGELARAARLWGEGAHEAAIAAIAALLAASPTDGELALRLGMALMQRGRLAEAVAAMEPAASVAPEEHPVHEILGRALGAVHWHERGPEAIAALRARVAELPDDADRHGALAAALLSSGRLAEAWPHYAWRWRGKAIAARAPDRPLVRPDPAGWAGKRVLLFVEQGLGDALQFLRYVPMAMRHAREVVVEVYPPLLRLARTLPGAPHVVAEGAAQPPWDEAVPLMHLPWAFGTDLATVPAAIPISRLIRRRWRAGGGGWRRCRGARWGWSGPAIRARMTAWPTASTAAGR